MLKNFFKTLAPFAALALGAAVAGCNDMDVSINGEEGVPLADLDMGGTAPSELVVATSANVIVTEGEVLDVTVEGDEEAVSSLRFVNKDGSLGIAREKSWKGSDGTATVRVTMPAPKTIVIAGSGSVEAPTMASKADLVIGGSGTIKVAEFNSETVEVKIGGSGSVTGGGKADKLEITIGGSGDVDFGALQAGDAEIQIGGAGDVSFMSDGKVEATIAGSGDIKVSGSAKCTVNSFGSGTLTCSSKPAEATAEETVAEE